MSRCMLTRHVPCSDAVSEMRDVPLVRIDDADNGQHEHTDVDIRVPHFDPPHYQISKEVSGRA